MRDHQDGFAIFLHEPDDEAHDFVGALAVQVTGGLVAQEEGRVGDDGAGDGYALFLSARELARVVVHAIAETHDVECGFDVLAAVGFREIREQER